jgi:hypothetical protein
MRILRGSAFVLMALFLAGAGSLQAVAPPEPWKCPFSEPECESIPLCLDCENNECRTVYGAGEGWSDCRTIYWQATPTSCYGWGTFCMQIIVTP